MPGGLTGLDLFKRFKQEKTALKAILSSGYSSRLASTGLPTEPDITYLSKPYNVTTLATVVRQCLDQA